MADIEELQKNVGFTVAGRSKTRTVTFLPEPERQHQNGFSGGGNSGEPSHVET